MSLIGRQAPAPLPRELRAGPLDVELDGIDLRAIRLGGLEIVRRLGPAIRDAWWGTIPPVASELKLEANDTSFAVRFSALHRDDSLSYRWDGAIRGTAEGSIEYEMMGKAEGSFRCSRIGLCVLHPREQAGRPYRAITPDGAIGGTLPIQIGPQRVEDGRLFPLFESYRSLEIDVVDGLTVQFSFEGDLFEMEDQRNWTDASFKTYSTPLAVGTPRSFVEGQVVYQRVLIQVGGPRRSAPPLAPDPITIVELGGPTDRRLPAVGVCLPDEGPDLGVGELELLGALHLDHVRLRLDLTGTWETDLARGIEAVRRLGVALELAIALGGETGADRAALAGLAVALAGAGVTGGATDRRRTASADARLARVLVVGGANAVSGSEDVSLVRAVLGDVVEQVCVAGGTDLWFAQLNSSPGQLEGLDGLCYSTAATVHASDDRSVMETPLGMGDTVRAARALGHGRDVFVGPVSLRPRAWPAGRLAGEGGLPFSVDSRQPSLLAAAWTVASLSHLAEAGASAVTCFEAAGWRGVIPSQGAPGLNGTVPPTKRAVFPVFHVLADWTDLEDDGVLATISCSQPYVVSALFVLTERGPSGLVANLTPRARQVLLTGLRLEGVGVRVLEVDDLDAALARPLAFRRRRAVSGVRADGTLCLELGPYAVARVDPA